MGNLSYHYNHRDFACRCDECKGKGEFKIHLGLVGALEMIWEHFGKPVRIITGYRCETSSEKQAGGKSLHNKGKAVNISVDDVALSDLFKFAEGMDELGGIGFYPEEKSIHVDTREGIREEWIKEGGKYIPLTGEKRRQWNL